MVVMGTLKGSVKGSLRRSKCAKEAHSTSDMTHAKRSIFGHIPRVIVKL